jgi:hypothetical protein
MEKRHQLAKKKDAVAVSQQREATGTVQVCKTEGELWACGE